MIQLTDQLGRKVQLISPAVRIISLVPSQTELLAHLNLKEETIGITKFCVHPIEWFRTKERIGATKKVDLLKVRSLNPDLIIANKEENTLKDIEALSANFEVYVSDVKTLEEASAMMRDVAVLCNRQQLAVDLIDKIQEDVRSFPKYRGKVLYFIWRNPYMVCGAQNFIDTMIGELGFENMISEPRYIKLSKEQIQGLEPDFIFLSTEPFPFNTMHIEELKKITKACIKIVDGEMFSWYGSRMLKTKEYFSTILDQKITGHLPPRGPV